MGGGTDGYQLVCGGWGVSGCATSHGHGHGAYSFVNVQDVLDSVEGVDGRLFYHHAGHCHGISATILRVCVPVRPVWGVWVCG